MALTHLPLHDTPDLRDDPGRFPSQFAAMVNYMDKLVGRIVATLDRLGLRERTLILISHRLSTLSGVDRIVVLDRGRVVEEGTHDELMARNGLYTGLFRRHLLEQRLTGELVQKISQFLIVTGKPV